MAPKATHVHTVLCGGARKSGEACGNVFAFDVARQPNGDHEATTKTGPKCPECGADSGHTTVSIEEA